MWIYHICNWQLLLKNHNSNFDPGVYLCLISPNVSYILCKSLFAQTVVVMSQRMNDCPCQLFSTFFNVDRNLKLVRCSMNMRNLCPVWILHKFSVNKWGTIVVFVSLAVVAISLFAVELFIWNILPYLCLKVTFWKLLLVINICYQICVHSWGKVKINQQKDGIIMDSRNLLLIIISTQSTSADNKILKRYHSILNWTF